jgi:hypothetical protein
MIHIHCVILVRLKITYHPTKITKIVALELPMAFTNEWLMMLA